MRQSRHCQSTRNRPERYHKSFQGPIRALKIGPTNPLCRHESLPSGLALFLSVLLIKMEDGHPEALMQVEDKAPEISLPAESNFPLRFAGKDPKVPNRNAGNLIFF